VLGDRLLGGPLRVSLARSPSESAATNRARRKSDISQFSTDISQFSIDISQLTYLSQPSAPLPVIKRRTNTACTVKRPTGREGGVCSKCTRVFFLPGSLPGSRLALLLLRLLDLELLLLSQFLCVMTGKMQSVQNTVCPTEYSMLYTLIWPKNCCWLALPFSIRQHE
jgi:hypothetical protein